MFFRALLSRQAVIWSWLLSCGNGGWGFLRKTHTLTFTYVLKNSWLIPCAAHSIYQCKTTSTDIPFCSCTRLLSCSVIPLVPFAPKDCHRMWAKRRRENLWVQGYASVTHDTGPVQVCEGADKPHRLIVGHRHARESAYVCVCACK